VHFPAYGGKTTIKEVRWPDLYVENVLQPYSNFTSLHVQILTKESMKGLITGFRSCSSVCSATNCYDVVYLSFLETLVQSLYDVAVDIREYLRLGRSLWLTFISSCDPANIQKTLESARRSANSGRTNQKTFDTLSIQREILSILDQRISPLCETPWSMILVHLCLTRLPRKNKKKLELQTMTAKDYMTH
jgi:hypothetical protein